MTYLMISIPTLIFLAIFVIWLFIYRHQKEYCFRLILLNIGILAAYLLLLYLMIPMLPELHVIFFFALAGIVHLGAFSVMLFRDVIKMLRI